MQQKLNENQLGESSSETSGVKIDFLLDWLKRFFSFGLRLRRTPLAWLQLVHEKPRLLAAIAGIAFADILIFMQLGFQGALFDLCKTIPKNLETDLVILSRQTETFALRVQPFSRRIMYEAMNHPQVEKGSPLYTATAQWKNPTTGIERGIAVIGFQPFEPLLNVPGVAENLRNLRNTDGVLFDRDSRIEFGEIVKDFEAGKRVEVEANKRKVEVEGLVNVGASFAADGTILVSDLNFLRLFPDRKPEEIDAAALRLKAGADAQQVKSDLQKMLSPDVLVLTKKEFGEFEENYWAGSTPIGFIFKFGAFLGFIVGVIITYQVLYTDVVSHLPEYATLKAMGYTNAYLTKVVFQESFILSIVGFIPGFFIALGLYVLAGQGANLELRLEWDRAIMVLLITIVMCFVSGMIAIRKLRQADPADIF
jgi:putative ABC transport system permease protein